MRVILASSRFIYIRSLDVRSLSRIYRDSSAGREPSHFHFGFLHTECTIFRIERSHDGPHHGGTMLSTAIVLPTNNNLAMFSFDECLVVE
jgi:hypothetical protein